MAKRGVQVVIGGALLLLFPLYQCQQIDPISPLYPITLCHQKVENKSAPTLNEKREIILYCYSYLRDPKRYNPIPPTPLILQSNGSGQLLHYEKSWLLLPQGEYTFYALSTTPEEGAPPAIEEGVSQPLSNGVDYLFAKITKVEVTQPTRVTLAFSHLCSSIEIEIKESPVDPTLKIERVILTPPIEGVRLSLTGGKLEQVERIDPTPKEMRLSNSRAELIVLPTAPLCNVTLTIQLREELDGRVVEKSGQLPLPVEGWQGGKRYSYRVELTQSSIQYIGSTLKEWREEPITTVIIEES